MFNSTNMMTAEGKASYHILKSSQNIRIGKDLKTCAKQQNNKICIRYLLQFLSYQRRKSKQRRPCADKNQMLMSIVPTLCPETPSDGSCDSITGNSAALFISMAFVCLLAIHDWLRTHQLLKICGAFFRPESSDLRTLVVRTF